MKKYLLQTSFIATFFLSCIALNGARPTELIVSKTTEPMKFILHTGLLKSARVDFSIVDNNGTQVYADQINTEKVPARLFDMSQLEKGDYIIELEEELKITRYQLTVDKGSIQIVSEPEYYYKPIFKSMEEGKIGLTMLTLGKAIKVQLMDDRETLHTLLIKDNDSISKIYDLSELPGGRYLFKVSTDKRTFYHTVNI